MNMDMRPQLQDASATPNAVAPENLDTTAANWLRQLRLCIAAGGMLGVFAAAAVVLLVGQPSQWLLVTIGSLLTTVTALLLVERYLLRPVIARQRRDAAEKRELTLSLETASRMQAKRESDTLRALVEDNQRLMESGDNEKQRADRVTAQLAVTMEVSTEALLMVGSDGQIQALTETAATMLAVHRASSIGGEFNRTVRLYEAERDHPTEYPITNLVARAIESRSGLPTTLQAVMPEGAQLRPVLVSASAVRAADTSIAAVLVRLDWADTLDTVQSARRSGATDADTGLRGRETFLRRVEELIEIAQAQTCKHTLILAALDNLSTISAELGHEAGDHALWQAARLLQEVTGTEGECYRVGIDHFAVLLPFGGPEKGKALAERVCDRMETAPYEWEGQSIELTVSSCVAAISPDTASSTSLMREADHGLIQARKLGGIVTLAQEDESTALRRRDDRGWINWLMPRLEDHRTHLISQTIEPLSTRLGQLPMFEVLLRVEDDDGVWVTPGEFMPSVVRHRLGARIDELVLRRLLAHLRDKSELLENYELASINISGQSLLDPDFGERVADMLRMESFAQKICFEIDESFVISHLHEAERFLSEVGRAGGRCALDRCQSALPSPAMRQLPIYMAKIHSAVVHRVEQDPLDAASLQWIVEANHMLGRLVVAVGVESESMRDALVRIGPDYVQGIHVNKMGPLIT